MTTFENSLTTPAPLPAAPELSDYPQFNTCEIPLGSGASNALTGFIRPFSDDSTARQVLRAIDANLPLYVSGGRLNAEVADVNQHPFEYLLVNMAIPCTVMVLDFEGVQPLSLYMDCSLGTVDLKFVQARFGHPFNKAQPEPCLNQFLVGRQRVMLPQLMRIVPAALIP